MDIAIAVWLYDPNAEYLLKHSNATKYSDIVEWRGPSELPTEEVLQQLWDDYVAGQLPPELGLEERVVALEEEVRKLKERNPTAQIR